ncbi:MAG: response regulator [Phycisphaerae bacterium]|nr:response regulator [Phycisphaerae bacterium]
MADKPKTVLLIDDDADVHEVVKMILEPQGLRVECALTGPKGLEAARELMPDVLLLDIMLDTPSEGFHIAYTMKSDEVLKAIPIVIISSIGQKMGIDYAKELGTEYVPASRFIDKPFDAATLLAAVNEAMEGAKE